MKKHSGQRLITVLLALLCSLLLSTAALAAETAVKDPTVAEIQPEDAASADISPSEEPAASGIEGPQEEIGPGIKKTEKKEALTTDEAIYQKGESLGTFSVTGYCPCSKCSGEHGLTYSGTVPRPNHTLSADLTVLPLGTKIMIDNIVYTVEDIGGNVDGHTIDIFFATHEEALAFGRQTKEAFAVIES